MTNKHPPRHSNRLIYPNNVVRDLGFFSDVMQFDGPDEAIAQSWRERFAEKYPVEERLPSRFKKLLGKLGLDHLTKIRSDFGPDFWGPADFPAANALEFMANAASFSKRQGRIRKDNRRFSNALREGRADNKFAYDAAALAHGHPLTLGFQQVLANKGHEVDFTRGVEGGTPYHYARTINRPEYPMREVTSVMIDSHDDTLKPLIRDRIVIEWGPGDGTHFAHIVKNCGKPKVVVFVDRSQINLDQSRAKARAAGLDDNQIITICGEFFDRKLLEKHEIFTHIRNSGIGITHLVLGNTLWNYTDDKRMPFLQSIGKFFGGTAKKAKDALVTTNDWTQDWETNVRAYLCMEYEGFYLRGMMFGCLVENLRMNLNALDIHVERIAEGLRVGLLNTARQYVSPCLNPNDISRFTSFAPYHDSSITLERGQFLQTILAERPPPEESIAEFLATGWEKLTLPHENWLDHTLPYRDSHNLLAHVGTNIWTPSSLVLS